MSVYLVDPEHIHVLLHAAGGRPTRQHDVSWPRKHRSLSGVVGMISTVPDGGARGGEVMVETLVDSGVAERGQTFELPDGFAVTAFGEADSWNGFPVPILGLVDALRVCLHVSEDADLYLCSPLSDGKFAADGLQWQQRSTGAA